MRKHSCGVATSNETVAIQNSSNQGPPSLDGGVPCGKDRQKSIQCCIVFPCCHAVRSSRLGLAEQRDA